jgi:uncharacterized OB-fold protein
MTLRPQPRFPEPDSQPFWEATKEKKLIYQTCDSCHKIIFYPRAHCPSCGSLENSWNESKGDGILYTYSVVMQSRHPAFKDLGAYAIAYVDLDEGFRIMTNIINVDDPVNDLEIGMKVKLSWQDQGEGEIALPMFEPA